MKKALITGVTGQTGSYMADFLLEKGYEVYGLARRTSTDNTGRISHLLGSEQPNFRLVVGNVLDAHRVHELIEEILPDEIYHFAADSHVGYSFANSRSSFEVGTLGTLSVLDAIKSMKDLGKTVPRLYFAGSSEQFGESVNEEGYQNEDTEFVPNSPYAVAKLAAFELVRVYRKCYNLNVCSGISFNHESERRGNDFVTRKISRHVARVVGGSEEVLNLGNLDASRDWMHALDVCDGAHRMLQQPQGGFKDYVLSSGTTHTVRDFCNAAYGTQGIVLKWEGDNATCGLDKLRVTVDPKLKRPCDVPYLRGDSKRVREDLGWENTLTFDQLVYRMVQHDVDQVNV